ncbi:DNA-formamidopyrimidine glycosylase family protein [Christiangramia forsetii]|uniref:Formamidopyrimidine-DNA glycosylase n=2 Tax=Christiangramia forsetii TaxID=411153 RepID=A0M6B1_CHRFK|nr:DNA-formamidopyrimidine glycosylase family protein [Christiangramia forsetii]GGG30943.1 formamidopyrimidine-DNA glycosylase [Christiangramia forsetii]CAL68156.1 formamidopyrimidine-DNA glycosylase [Christiangramia forsetii KT0803]
MFYLYKTLKYPDSYRDRVTLKFDNLGTFNKQIEMPELPEVAYQKIYVDSTSLHHKIVKVDMGADKIFQSPKSEFEATLLKNEFVSSTQIGKYLLLKLKEKGYLVVHFGMTGKMDYFQHDEIQKHAQLTLTFEDGGKLSFVCPRKFGKLFLTTSPDEFRKKQKLGPHATEISEEDFHNLFDGKRGSVKTALMDQSFIAGLGNLYVDEILFQSGIHPKSKSENLSDKDLSNMFKNMVAILETVTKSKTEGNPIPDTYLRNHRNEGEACPIAKGKIKMIKVGGRSTYFCSECQEEK